ncbi:MAG: hypothetical protein ACLSDQ_05560 [Adlercreutzia equolifaciens]
MTQNAERRMRVQDGQVVDDLDARQMAAEDLMLGMRMARGVSDERVARAARSSTAPKRVAAVQRPLRSRGSVLVALDELADLGPVNTRTAVGADAAGSVNELRPPPRPRPVSHPSSLLRHPHRSDRWLLNAKIFRRAVSTAARNGRSFEEGSEVCAKACQGTPSSAVCVACVEMGASISTLVRLPK